MKGFLKLFLLIALIFSWAAPGQALAQTPQDSSDFEFSVLASFSAFSFDGAYRMFEAPVAFGAQYTPRFVDVGFYFAPIIEDNNDDTFVTISALLHARVFERFGFGLGYKFWETQIGLLGPTKTNLFFSLSFELTTPGS